MAGKVETRPLGKNGPEGDEERFALLDKAYEMGETFWDTSDAYGDSEDLIGKWFAANPEKRKDIFLGTKFGVQFDPATGMKTNSTPEYCREALDKSLKRLRQSCVDLYYIHRLDKVTPIEKTVEAMVELKNAGKIKHIGLSECSAESLRRAHVVHPIACVQVEYSAFLLAIEKNKLLATARELGVAIVAYSPLGNGILTNTLRTRQDFTKPGDMRGMLPWLSADNIETNMAVVDKISEIAKAKGVTTAQLALAWLLNQGDEIFAIPGTTKASRVAENLGSLSITLTPEEEQAIRKLSEGVVGGRVQDMMGGSFLDTPPL
ncbi:Aldo/keto reductase [Diaporthe amygdali]|uniref:Aldo/keto reductase n=1 Tax=Phomopsis amygdali TaxID=1214568 RepID=UPI0022FE861C|nr:Aldo/keto reductase [Diaporthe amygdali]KAJ0114229.1 Aldo/keto reductase [Diaporthe amygdali]